MTELEHDSQKAFEPSALGTKQHWDSVYGREVDTFREIGDTGEAWFGEEAVDKMVSWTEKHMSKNAKVVDLGSGNGHLLIALAEAGFTNLTGVDYSENAVTLASEVLAACTNLQEGTTITYHVMDLTMDIKADGGSSTAGAIPLDFREAFDLAVDKGTYDAICLSPENAEAPPGSAPKEKYFRVAASLLKPNARFLITSCNWTQDEIIAQTERYGFKYHSHQKYPTIKFGGVEGQRIWWEP
ncbi:hypothetical protein HDU93_003777 [Gonapodya sp. JEL0774]|nr:hypothetical protein HDU93_003777 [Gonapodya sp. JEL0774]